MHSFEECEALVFGRGVYILNQNEASLSTSGDEEPVAAESSERSVMERVQHHTQHIE